MKKIVETLQKAGMHHYLINQHPSTPLRQVLVFLKPPQPEEAKTQKVDQEAYAKFFSKEAWTNWKQKSTWNPFKKEFYKVKTPEQATGEEEKKGETKKPEKLEGREALLAQQTNSLFTALKIQEDLFKRFNAEGNISLGPTPVSSDPTMIPFEPAYIVFSPTSEVGNTMIKRLVQALEENKIPRLERMESLVQAMSTVEGKDYKTKFVVLKDKKTKKPGKGKIN